MPKSAKGRRFSLVVAAVVFLVGLGLLLWRPVSNAVTQWQMDRAVASFESESAQGAAEGEGDAGADADDADDAAMRARFSAYNERVRQGAAGAINDPFSTAAQEDLGLAFDQGEVIGTIDIPAMGCTLPLYFGASSENMAKGATVVASTSLPLGEGDSNCVIAAHRGWNSAAMFRDIENLEPGDDVYVTNRWETLRYRVAEVRVVDPSDTAACAVQAGRDLVTLLTCHPYGVHPSPSRMLVYCERVGDGDAAADTSTQDAAAGNAESNAAGNALEASSLLTIENALQTAGCAIVAAFLIWAIATRIRKK